MSWALTLARARSSYAFAVLLVVLERTFAAPLVAFFACFRERTPRSVDPGWVYQDAVAAVWAIGADGDQLEAVVPGFERPHRCGADANDIPAAELADLVVEPDSAGAAD